MAVIWLSNNSLLEAQMQTPTSQLEADQNILCTQSFQGLNHLQITN